MSKAASRIPDGEPADVTRALEESAAGLYALPPDAFAAARDEQVRAARAAGRQPLARELGRLRRPTQSAWLINLLWRDQRDVLEQFLQLGQELRRAQAEASGPELHRLTALRRELESALIRTARGLAHQAGVNVSASMEREAQETLSAALARPEVADEVRSGRLVKPAAYAGFGNVLAAPTPIRAPAPEAAGQRTQQSEAAAGAPPTNEGAVRAAEREARARREATEQALQDARAVVARAAAALGDEARAAAAAEQRHTTLRAEIDQLEAQLRTLQERLRETQKDLATAEHRTAEAHQAHEQAQRALERAEREL